MPAIDLSPALALIAAWGGMPLRPLHTLVRNTKEKFRPRRIIPYRSSFSRAQQAMRKDGGAGFDGGATILCERGVGRMPTIVLGGFVPDATEQVFLLRRFLLKYGDVFYAQYPRDAFSLDLLCAQLSDLVEELSAEGRPPVVLGVSFGAGVLIEWFRRARLAHEEPAVAGVVLVSPITCAADLLEPGASKPATLLGRSLKPYLDSSRPPTDATVERSRLVFLRMFEAGAQNKFALRMLMSTEESEQLRHAVMATIRGITSDGAQQRVQALAAMIPPIDYFYPAVLPLSRAPALILFAEREEAVLTPLAPVRLALERAAQAYFPDGTVRRVSARAGTAPVQHASLIFHVFEFLPPLRAFYQRVRRDALALAA